MAYLDPWQRPACMDGSDYYPSFSVTLGELVEGGVVVWGDEANPCYWGASAYSSEQYARVCELLNLRYWSREISMIPPGAWIRKLKYRIIGELCPKYNPLYEAIDGVNVLADSDKYGKRREIGSDYPETLLSGNSDYISTGRDEEYEDVEVGRLVDTVPEYMERWRAVDTAFLDDLEIMFATVITANVNGE